MKRLNSIIANMDLNTSAYTEMYNGRMRIYDPDCAKLPPFLDEDPTYYRGDIGFEIRGTHKLAQDKPTVTVVIPCDRILTDRKGNVHMKRLKYFLQHMEESTAAYKEMYEGEMIMHFPPSPTGHVIEPKLQRDPFYWYKDRAVELEAFHKLAKDKPTITWHIPVDQLGMDVSAFGGEGDSAFTGKLGSRMYVQAAADYCLREFGRYIDELNSELYNRSRPDKENGKYYLSRPGGEVLARNASCFAMHVQKDYRNGSGINVYLLNDGVPRPPRMCLCLKLQVQLPQKRLKKAARMLCQDLPDAVDRFVEEFDAEGLGRALELAGKQAYIRGWLKKSEYCAFIANGSILPRDKGTGAPMQGAVPFLAPPEAEIEIGGIRGMGIRRGVTVITGGGYSGKSTFLDAISAGIYNHVPGDGRELCITDDTAVTISAEDGRSVKCTNISPFIQWIPGGDARFFSTDKASGSTSQAANIMEALDGGAGLLLIDEDRSATNFMIRDGMMKELVLKEPITPFTDRVREISERFGVSTILVIGGSGEYLEGADRIYMMEDYGIQDVTKQAKQICRRRIKERSKETADGELCAGLTGASREGEADWSQKRILCSEGFTSYPRGSGSERLEVTDMGFILIGDEKIDIRGLHDIVSPGQLDALGFMLRYLEIKNAEAEIDLKSRVEELYDRIGMEGLDFLYSSYFIAGRRFLDLPRKHELLALVNRMRGIRFREPKR